MRGVLFRGVATDVDDAIRQNEPKPLFTNLNPSC
jgi:hypothetical protein